MGDHKGYDVSIYFNDGDRLEFHSVVCFVDEFISFINSDKEMINLKDPRRKDLEYFILKRNIKYFTVLARKTNTTEINIHK